uniref:Chromosome 18 open reading frame 54 n=1 Tax=Pelodiscus sinensis TaxID=13735 RepID=K7GCI9_PELSI|nr:lung adenoma susceptibility protein 2 isoform X1 [Pelodiscus sinensis]|eukprot:XP_006136978.1 lung adenoma susceptibility protein 2 isoform X1 [Pelodiscus sinensis]
MACSFEKDSIFSPESTVSSLLASCSLNNSNSHSNSSIQYKDKVYDSASRALEAYIEDFNQSLMSSEVSTGKICIGQSTPKDKSAKCGSVQKYALEDFNQQVKLNSIASPFIRQTLCDPDLISLTTDDLLAFPADGSLPFIYRTPSGLGLQSGKWIRKSLKKSAFYPYQNSSFDVEKDFGFQDNAVDTQNQNRDIGKEKYNVYKSHKYHSLFSKENSGDHCFQQHSIPVSDKNYPRWLTSHKSDLNVSGISSIPDFNYPIWLKSNNLLSDSANQSFIQTLNIQEEFSSSKNCENLKKTHIVDKLNCNSFEQNSYVDPTDDNEVTGNCSYDRPSAHFQPSNVLSRQSKQPFRDDQIELLILKAKRTLESSVENLSSALKNDSPCTVDILEGERSWENVPVAFKPPVPVQCDEVENTLQSPKAHIVNEFLEDCLNHDSQENTFSGGNHHGPVEALKLMLFNLQAVHESFNQNKTAEQNDELKKVSEEAVAELKLCDNDMIPITKSLRRALHHLSRLKGLVEDTTSKQDQKSQHPEDRKEKNSIQIRNILLETE